MGVMRGRWAQLWMCVHWTWDWVDEFLTSDFILHK